MKQNDPQPNPSDPAKAPSEPAPHLAARKLRAEILAAESEVCLGSEMDVMERLQLSRATLRQAARILEQEQLLIVRRGPGGGYFTRRPDVTSLANAASLYLRLEGTTFLDVLHTANLINMEIVRLAAESGDEEKKANLRDILGQWTLWEEDTPSSAALIHADGELVNLLARLAGNAPLTMFLQTVYRFGMTETHADLFGAFSERRKEMVRRRIQLMQAIIAGDADIAALIAHRINVIVTEWVKSDDIHALKSPIPPG